MSADYVLRIDETGDSETAFWWEKSNNEEESDEDETSRRQNCVNRPEREPEDFFWMCELVYDCGLVVYVRGGPE